jgi:integrase
MTVRMINKSWWVDLRADHQRYRRRSPENTKTGALAYEAVLRQKFARGEPIDVALAAQQQTQTFEQFAWGWFEDYVVPNNKYSEQRAKEGMLKRTLIPFFGKMRVDQISTHQIEQYKGQQIKQGISNKTLRNRLTVLRKCLCCAHEWLALDGPPPKVKWPKCPPPRTDYLTLEECELLLSHADGIVYEMILATLRTGVRQGELKGLQWSSIDWPNRSIAIRYSHCDVRKVLDTPKGNRERHIPLDIDVCEMLHKRKQTTGYVFTDANGKPFNSPRLNSRLAKVCKKAGLRIITWHTLRHTFATRLATLGIPLHTVQALLGHSSIATTMRYAHVAPSTLRSAIDMLNPKTAVHADFGQQAGKAWMREQRIASKQRIISSGR